MDISIKYSSPRFGNQFTILPNKDIILQGLLISNICGDGYHINGLSSTYIFLDKEGRLWLLDADEDDLQEAQKEKTKFKRVTNAQAIAQFMLNNYSLIKKYIVLRYTFANTIAYDKVSAN